MVKRLMVILAVVTVQVWCAGSHKMVMNAEVEGVLGLSKDTVWENGFYDVSWRDTVVIRNLTTDSLSVDSMLVDTMFSMKHNRSYGPEYNIRIRSPHPVRPTAFYEFRPHSASALSMKMPSPDSVMFTISEMKYDWFPTDGSALTYTGFQDTAMARLLIKTKNTCDTLFIIGIVDVYDSTIRSSRPLFRGRREFIARSIPKQHFTIHGRSNGRHTETATGVIVTSYDRRGTLEQNLKGVKK